MSKHNYSQYSNKNNKPRSFEQSQTAVNNEPTVEPKVVTETVETVTVPEIVKGVVAGCTKLNVRENPNLFADVVGVLDLATEVKIDTAKSNNDWLYICNKDVKGYCMRKYVNAHM